MNTQEEKPVVLNAVVDDPKQPEAKPEDLVSSTQVLPSSHSSSRDTDPITEITAKCEVEKSSTAVVTEESTADQKNEQQVSQATSPTPDSEELSASRRRSSRIQSKEVRLQAEKKIKQVKEQEEASL